MKHQTKNHLLQNTDRTPTIQLDIGFRDLHACFNSFFHTINKQQCLNDIKSFWHTDKEILVTLSVRTSLDLLLQSLNLTSGIGSINERG